MKKVSQARNMDMGLAPAMLGMGSYFLPQRRISQGIPQMVPVPRMVPQMVPVPQMPWAVLHQGMEYEPMPGMAGVHPVSSSHGEMKWNFCTTRSFYLGS